jgi:hypothetical protein
MKSLMIHCGFKDKGTLQRAVEGLYRSGLIDVRVEAGSRLWACWKMNKKNIEYVAAIPERDAMQEPFLNSINTISSKDKNFTYQLNKEEITELMKFFMVTPVENPPLFNTITQYNYNTTSQDNHSTSLPHNYTTLPQQDYMEKVPSDMNKKEEMEIEFGKPMEESSFDKDINGVSEAMAKDEEETEEIPNQSQSLEKDYNGESQDSIPSELQAEESSTERLNEYQSYEKEPQQGQSNASKEIQKKAQEEFRAFKKDIDQELNKLKDCSTKDEFIAVKKDIYQFLDQKLDDTNFSHENVKERIESYISDTIDRMQSLKFWH